MKYNIKNIGGIGMKNEEIVIGENENGTVTMEVEKPKWSLRKKLLIGGGVLAGLVIGAIALGSKKAKPGAEDVEDSEDGDEAIDTEYTVVSEEPENGSEVE